MKFSINFKSWTVASNSYRVPQPLSYAKPMHLFLRQFSHYHPRGPPSENKQTPHTAAVPRVSQHKNITSGCWEVWTAHIYSTWSLLATSRSDAHYSYIDCWKLLGVSFLSAVAKTTTLQPSYCRSPEFLSAFSTTRPTAAKQKLACRLERVKLKVAQSRPGCSHWRTGPSYPNVTARHRGELSSLPRLEVTNVFGKKKKKFLPFHSLPARSSTANAN